MKESKTAAANRARLANLHDERLAWADANDIPRRIVLAWSPQRLWQRRNIASGRCYSCNRKRVTKNLCAACRDKANRQKRERRKR